MEKARHNMGKLRPVTSRFIEIPLSKVIKAAWNYKEDDEFQAKKLLESIKKNGQIETIIVREVKGKYEVVNGNHRFDALSSLGYESIMAYNLGKVPLEAAQLIAIETNENKFKADPIKLAELIQGIGKKFSLPDLSRALPFTEREINNFNNLLTFNPENLLGGRPKKEKESTEIRITLTPKGFTLWKKILKANPKKDQSLILEEALNQYAKKQR
jgi:hypothetical protein